PVQHFSLLENLQGEIIDEETLPDNFIETSDNSDNENIQSNHQLSYEYANKSLSKY
ncbi:13933_t:CDS:2, partial [Racocetra fulgida]